MKEEGCNSKEQNQNRLHVSVLVDGDLSKPQANLAEFQQCTCLVQCRAQSAHKSVTSLVVHTVCLQVSFVAKYHKHDDEHFARHDHNLQSHTQKHSHTYRTGPACVLTSQYRKRSVKPLNMNEKRN